jgi:orotidine-5'-phosphate decarboxylase
VTAREKLIVALDLPSAEAATRLAEKLRGRVGMFKVGSELFTAEGPVLARYLVASGEKVFLDLKFHDIPNTVRAAAREAAHAGVSLVNVHASGGRKMMEAALEGARSASRGGDATRTRVLAVTVLTSLAASELEELGMAGTPEEAVVRLARLAQAAGLDGVVASAREIAALRRACGPQFLIVTPGIRPATAATNDQARIATPGAAIEAGADYLVVGRPITEAADPAAAAEAIVAEMERAISPRMGVS